MGKQQRDVQKEAELACTSSGGKEATGKPKNGDDEETASIASFSTKGSALKSMVKSVLPKIEPLPWTTFFCLSIWCAIPAVAYVLLFTQMGFGESFYYALSHSQFGDYAHTFAGLLVISGFFFYIFDIDEWNSGVGYVFRFLSVAAMFSVFVLIVILISNEVTFGIITLFALINPLWLLMVKSLFYRGKDTRSFVSWLSGPLLLISVLTAAAFIMWVCLDYSNEWNSVTEVEAAERTGCAANFEDYPICVNEDGSGSTCFYVDSSVNPHELVFPENCYRMCLNVYDGCSNGFILWAGPVLICLSMLYLSFFCTFLRTDGTTNEKDIFNFGKLWLLFLFIMWASASLSGTAAGVTSSLLTLTTANLIGSAIILSTIFSREELHQNKEAVYSRIQDRYGDNNLEVARGLFIATCSPILVGYFFLSAINQLIRRIGINPCAQPTYEKNDPDKNSGIVTMRAKQQLTSMRSWDRAKVLTYAIYWGIAYMILNVLVANLTVVFLSWMIEKTAGFGLIAVTAIMCGVGVMMFLLPPVPGVPVYLTLGIVIAAQGHETLGWGGSILYSTGVGLLLKLFSSALQQKGIGENLSHYVKVRQFVSVNSTLMKSMRLVLGKGGLSIPKVAILIGGPDWPTSVLCGIMRLSLPQIMLGTTPIVFLIFPTCLTGALLYMASLETDTGNPVFPWAGTVTTLTASATAMVQFGSMIVAAYYLEQASESRADEVSAIEDDKEVKEADEKDEQMRKCYRTVTQWNAVPLCAKMALILSLASITASCYMVQFFSYLCFVEHTLTDSIYDNLQGNAGNLFLPLGWVSVALFVASIILLAIFSSWGKGQAMRLAESGAAIPLSNL
eukprot:CAMPEP_0172533624 /NCGR_PEP_ID=MMETSP1067-20121228/6258_1 /TAXON_ID=265564 ORGANISM="Thalassiosira punctigera, Strain Tpunct2005C2" /NCGR_SAMPLE_ID=MMETSP1067 /ASSEMBLY_ACC=CAM_ASM_000444 /LENGTH=844 /DNA_ID=CAMNT_0013318287 /DNA_START=162 /DNA_END=2696 /DNA_ORIENTATION=-